MQDIIKGDAKVMSGLERLCTAENSVRHTSDSYENSYNWYRLDRPEQIIDAAIILHDAGARLAIICAYNEHCDKDRKQGASYQFVLNGVVYIVTVHMDADHPSVPSITSIFNNADWHEREMMELYGIKITNHPNPRRLFLDEELDKGLLGQIVPLSIMMNGANSTDLWERILSDKESRS